MCPESLLSPELCQRGGKLDGGLCLQMLVSALWTPPCVHELGLYVDE